MPVQVTATDSIADENEESFEIQALEQIIESLKYVYQTVSESVSDVFDTETAYASEVSSEPVVYSGSQAGISPGGAVDGSLSEDASGVASWNQTATFSGGGYGGHTITVNSAVTTKSYQVNATNFNAVLQSLHLQVDGQSYTSFVATPLVINGVNYAGYLSSSSGSVSDFTIAIKDTNFNVYQMGGNFAYISSPMSTGEATVDNETDETTPSEDGSTETPTDTGEDTTTPSEDGSTETPTDTGEDTTTPIEDESTEIPTDTLDNPIGRIGDVTPNLEEDESATPPTPSEELIPNKVADTSSSLDTSSAAATNQNDNQQAETLPKTGEEESRSLGIIGTILIALAGFFGIGRKKKSKDDQDE